MNDPLMRRDRLRNAITVDRAIELVGTMFAEDDPDRIADAMEAAASDADLAHAVIFRLLGQLRGWPQQSGVAIVAAAEAPSPVLFVPEEL